MHDKYKRETHIIDPFNSRLKFSQTEMDLNREHNCPVSFPVRTDFGLCTSAQRRQIRANNAKRRKVICTTFREVDVRLSQRTRMPDDPFRNYISTSITPNLNLENGQHG